MADTIKILIQEKDGVTSFEPNPAVAKFGDLVFWSNDTPKAHWPMPKGGEKDAWLPFQIPGRKHGQEPATSDNLALPAAEQPYEYVCAKHPHEPGGSIKVSK